MDFTNPDLRYSRSSDQLSAELDGEIATLNLGSKLYFGFADVAATIWRELQSPTTFEALNSAVMAEYDVKEDQCRKDLSDFLQTLLEKGLVEVEAEAH